jgi:hypothetical protein
MSYRYPELKIAVNHNAQGSFVPIESVVIHPPKVKPVPLGGSAVKVLSRKIVYTGAQVVLWRWGFMSMTDLNAFITTYLGGWTTENANVTIRTFKRSPTNGVLTYGNYNAILHLPHEEIDYVQETTETVSDLRVSFDIIAEI